MISPSMQYKNQRSWRSIERLYYSFSIRLYFDTFILQPYSNLLRQSCSRQESNRADQSWEVTYWFSALRKPSLKDCYSQMAFICLSLDYNWRFYWASRCTSLLSSPSPRSIRSSIFPWLNFSLLMGCLFLGYRFVRSANPVVYFLVSSLLLPAVGVSLTLLTVRPGDSFCCRWKLSWAAVWPVLCCLAAESLREILMISSSMRWKREECLRRGVRQSFIVQLQNYRGIGQLQMRKGGQGGVERGAEGKGRGKARVFVV